MIPRYTPEDMARLWSDLARYQRWFDVELAACSAMEEAGLVPRGTADALAPVRSRLDPARIEAIEARTRHDVIAFLTHVEELGGDAARWLHLGMTSSDVLDTSLALAMREAADRLVERLDRLVDALLGQVERYRATPMMGRSHGIFAEPITFGQALAGHAMEWLRARDVLLDAKATISVGKIAGAVGTYAHFPPSVERRALQRLGLRPETVPTQVVARDRHARYVASLGLLAAGLERFATNVRHWQRTEVGEALEPFGSGQKGSSAMPHKRNPILSENLCGLARVVRAAVVPAMEDVALWHERDISHSSVERVVLPDATTALAFMLDRARRIVEGLEVHPERMTDHLERSGGAWASEAVLLQLVRSGLPRQRAYEIVQRHALAAQRGGPSLLEGLLGDDAVRERLTESALREAFTLEHALRHVDEVIRRALQAARSRSDRRAETTLEEPG